MTTERKINSNRRNSQRSTGPSTPAGKARSSLNALKHGLRSRTLVVLDSEHQEASEFVERTWATLEPIGLQEEWYVELIIEEMIRVRRASVIEVALLRHSTPESMYDLVKKIADNDGLIYEAAARRALSVKRIVSGKRTVKSAPRSDESDPPPEGFGAAASGPGEVVEPPDSLRGYPEQDDGSGDGQATLEGDTSDADAPIRVVTADEVDNAELELLAENSVQNERTLALLHRSRTAGVNRIRKVLRELEELQQARRSQSNREDNVDYPDENSDRDGGDLPEEG